MPLSQSQYATASNHETPTTGWRGSLKAIAPERRRRAARAGEKRRVLGVRRLAGGERERVDPDAMDRTLVIGTVVRSHQERPRFDGDEHRHRHVGGEQPQNQFTTRSA
jgi:hypothetical protein